MERLTEKVEGENSYNIDVDFNSKLADDYDLINGADSIESVVSKLGKLEDVEEKLGIGLITLFKALKDGFYVRGEDHKNTSKVSLVYNFYDDKEWALLTFHYGYEADIWLYLKDYGKTWALTREELE